MSRRPPSSMGRAIGALIPERRLYIRSEQRTRYLSLGTGTQIGFAVAIAAALGWTGFTTTAYVTRAMDGRAAEIKLENVKEAYQVRLTALAGLQQDLEEQLNRANLRRDAVTERLSDKQARLVDTANTLQEAEAELKVLRVEFQNLIAVRRDDATRIATLETALQTTRLAQARAEAAEANLTDVFATFNGAMKNVIAERDSAVDVRSRLDGEVARLTVEIDRRKDRQERLLSQLENAARSSLTGLESMFSRPNIDIDRILAQARRDYSGSGGPFEPLFGEADAEIGQAAIGGGTGGGTGERRIASLMRDLETVNLMRFAAQRLPFGVPVRGGRWTSGFGPRHDPKGRGRGMHSGFDIAAPRGTAIFTTADGLVTFSGRKRGYGIVVKIRHAFGFETVYAHLNRSRVKVGQRVERGDRIADMGSTGRSTGSHLHYEIRIDQEPVNPVKFIEAARDVL